MSTVSDGLYQFGGVPVNGFMTGGKTLFVRPSTGSDGNSGKTPAKALKTLSQAHSLATADKGDVVYLIAESDTASSTTDYQSAALTWSKDSVHLIGMNANPFIGQRSRIAELSTVKTIEDLVTFSADNIYVRGIEVFQGVASSTATAARAVVVSGIRSRYELCQFSGNGDTGGSTDDAGARSLHVSGRENYFKDCYIGLDTVIRATQTAEVTVGAIARTIFDGCMINSYTSLSTFYALAATSLDRFILLKNCILSAVQGITSSVAPTAAISNTTPNGQIWGMGSGVFGYADVTAADATNVLWLSHYATTVVDMGVAKATDVA